MSLVGVTARFSLMTALEIAVCLRCRSLGALLRLRSDFSSLLLDNFRKRFRSSVETLAIVPLCSACLLCLTRHRSGAHARRFRQATPVNRRSAKRAKARLYCRHGSHARISGRFRRRAAQATRRARHPFEPARGRSRRSHRRGRRAAALRPPGLPLDVRLLHPGAAPVGGRGLSSNHRCPRRSEARAAACDAVGRPLARDGRGASRPAAHGRELRGGPRAGDPPHEAPDRGARG